MIGQDAVTTAQAFLDGVGFDGVVLTKLDGDARGGAALSVASVTGRQIMFASNGEKLDDFDAFHPERMASRILGMGDMLTLIEQAEKHFEAEQAEKMAQKLLKGGKGNEFTLEDFKQQMLQVRKMGSLQKIFGMLPGMGEFKEQLNSVDDADLDRVVAIINGMTPAEREDPKILNASRRTRIAKGSGVGVGEINQLVERFFEARKMMQQMAGGLGGMMPGMGGMPFGRGGGKKSRGKMAAKPVKAKGKGARSGNPAKRAAQQAAAESAAANGATPAFDPANFELPPEFRDLMPPGEK
jgi:signal recognition particle subunit SRP54